MENNGVTKLRITQVPFFLDNFSEADEHSDFPRSRLLLGHRRSGKTTGISLDARQSFIELFNHKEIFSLRGDIDSYNPTMYYFAPTKVQARDIIWGVLKKYLSPLPGLVMNNQSLSATLARPHLRDEITFKLMASKYHDSARGSKLYKAWVDEVQDAPPSAIPTSIRPALNDWNGTLTMTGTVKGRSNHLFDYYKLFIEEQWPLYVFPVTRTGLESVERIMRYKREGMDGSFEREYMMDFYAPVKGALFADTITQLELDNQHPFYSQEEKRDDLPVVLGVDIGVGEGFAVWAAQIYPENGRIHILDYYEDYDCTDDLKSDLLDDGYDPELVFIPHDGVNKVLQKEKKMTNKMIFKESFPKALIKVVKKAPNQMASIDNTRRHLHLCSFSGKEVTGHDCALGLQKLREYSKKFDKNTGVFTDQIDKSTGVDHAGDALRTLITGLKCRDGVVKYMPRKLDNHRIEIGGRSSDLFRKRGDMFSEGTALNDHRRDDHYSVKDLRGIA